MSCVLCSVYNAEFKKSEIKIFTCSCYEHWYFFQEKKSWYKVKDEKTWENILNGCPIPVKLSEDGLEVISIK